jgi:hypothetical protein
MLEQSPVFPRIRRTGHCCGIVTVIAGVVSPIPALLSGISNSTVRTGVSGPVRESVRALGIQFDSALGLGLGLRTQPGNIPLTERSEY